VNEWWEGGREGGRGDGTVSNMPDLPQRRKGEGGGKGGREGGGRTLAGAEKKAEDDALGEGPLSLSPEG